MKESLTYKDAGVDIHEGEKAVKLMKQHVQKTFNKNVLTGLGGFGGLFNLDLTDIEEPVLVSGTDGVGTKLKIAFMMDKHDTVGQDCVAMCVNDILCQGAKPLFFLDYIATGKLKAEKTAEIVKGIADGCVESECALIGGETAEMPDFYSDGEYDIAGFAVGIVDKGKIIDGSNIEEDNVLIGLPSSGIHSNGYSLVRKLFFDQLQYNIHDQIDELGNTVGEVLLTPTKIYTKACNRVISEYDINGIVHITGGGFYENIPRILPKGYGVEIKLNSWVIPPVFKYMKEKGNISQEEMYATFNMGIGLMMIADKNDAQGILEKLEEVGEKAAIIGQVIKGEGVSLCE
ncbi:MAG: phosphoribosylformylglycinamidine cyclo-ligase [Clostridia bacterium]|nr:phosphoribosylformylglycinamidine cyclo-ligase [Clostridia bacterium]